MTNKLTESDLRQFTGTDGYYHHWSRTLLYTDGIKYMAENGGYQGAYWLIDAIASYQPSPAIRKNRMLQEIQFWHLEVRPDHTATLTCRADENITPAITQEIEYTDFQFSIDVWVEGEVLMLPSER